MRIEAPATRDDAAPIYFQPPLCDCRKRPKVKYVSACKVDDSDVVRVRFRLKCECGKESLHRVFFKEDP